MTNINTQDDAVRFIRTAARDGGRWLLVSPACLGVTMIARRIGDRVTMSDETRMEASVVRHAAGLMREDDSDLVADATFRAPHHTCSTAALCGATLRGAVSGPRFRPGECSLAHGGTLFLDDLPEFRRVTVESVARTLAHGHVRNVPTRPHVLIASADPCACNYRDTVRCTCTPERLAAWDARVARLVEVLSLTVVHVNPWFDHDAPVSFDAALGAP
jgi:magnesium chelatase family protein